MSCCGNTGGINYIPPLNIELSQLQDVRQPICYKCPHYKTNNYNESFCKFIPKEMDEDECHLGYIKKYRRVNLDYLWPLPYAECPENKWYKIVEQVLEKK